MGTRSKLIPSRRAWLFLLLLIPLAALVWRSGVGIFREAQLPPATVVPTPISQAPAALNTSADYMAQGDYDFDQKNYAQAVKDYSRAIALNPGFAEAYNNRGYTYMTLENYPAALADFNQALTYRPAYVNALINRGDIYNYYYQIDRPRAIADYNRALSLDPHNAIACGHRAVAYTQGVNFGTLYYALTRGTDCSAEFEK